MTPASRPGSAYDVEDGYRRKLREEDPHRLEQRQKAVDKGKNTRAYAHYIKVIPKATRPVGTSEDEKKFPRTPDKYEIVSKRGWEGKVRAWRLRLHQYNPEPKPGEEVIQVPTQIPRDQRLGLNPKDSSSQQSKKRDREGEQSSQSSKRVSYGPGGAAPAVSPVKAWADYSPDPSPNKEAGTAAVPEYKERKRVSIFDEWSDGEDKSRSMDFDLSLIDEVGARKGPSQPARTSKFAPRAAARPKPKPLDRDQHGQVERQEGPACPAEKQSRQEERRLEDKTVSSSPIDFPQKNEDSGLPRGLPSLGPNEPAQHPLPTSPAAKTSPPTARGLSIATQKAEPLETHHNQQGTGRTESRTESRGTQKSPTQTQANHLALVPFEPEDEEQHAELSLHQTKRLKSAGGKLSKSGKRKLSTKEMAERKLMPGVNSIDEYVERAMAKERLLGRKTKKQKLTEGAEIQEQEEEHPLEETPVNSLVPTLEMLNGKMVPQAQSLVVQAQPEATTTKVTLYKNLINNQSHSKRIKSERWSEQETEVFFQAVAYFGANFELLSKMFKGRCRKMMANKWRRENKVNEQRCKEAMSSKGGREGYERVMRSIAGLNEDGEEAGPEETAVYAKDLFDVTLPASGTADMEPRSPKASSMSRQQSSAGKSGGRGRGSRRGRGRGRGQGSSARPEAAERLGTAESEPIDGDASLEGEMSEEPQKKASRRKSVPVKSTPGDAFAKASTANGQEVKSGRGRGRGRGRPRKMTGSANRGRGRKAPMSQEVASDCYDPSVAPSSFSGGIEA